MILRQVAVLAHPVRVLRPVVMRTRMCRFFPPVCMIAVLAHAFGVENAVDVCTLGDLAAGASLLLGLLRLTNLFTASTFGLRFFHSVFSDQRSGNHLILGLHHRLVKTVSGPAFQRRVGGGGVRGRLGGHDDLGDGAHFDRDLGCLSDHGNVGRAARGTWRKEAGSLRLEHQCFLHGEDVHTSIIILFTWQTYVVGKEVLTFLQVHAAKLLLLVNLLFFLWSELILGRLSDCTPERCLCLAQSICFDEKIGT